MQPVLAFALPIALSIAGAVCSLALDALERDRPARWCAALCLALAAVVAFVVAATVTPQPVWEVFVVGAGYSTAVATIMLFGAAAAIAHRSGAERSDAAFPGLVALSAAALAVLATSSDVLVMFLALETAAATGYALVALARSTRSSEAAMKYFVQGAIATALFVLGLAAAIISGVLVVADGRLVAGTDAGPSGAVIAAIALFLSVFAFKLGAVPFHSWAPDAYETAPPSSAAFLASAAKVGVLVALFTLLTQVVIAPGVIAQTQWLLAAIAAASVVFGNLAALAQRSYTRLLAYSGIAQVGYGLTAVVTGNGDAALLFVTAYGCAAAGAFVAAGSVRRLRPDWDGTISGMAGLAKTAPLLSAAVAVLLFSLTGIPPLLGFWGKFLVFLPAAASSTWAWLVVLGLLGSVVSFGYYGRVLRALYFDEEGQDDRDAEPVPEPSPEPGRDAGVFVVVLLSLIVIVVGILPLVSGFAGFVGVDPMGLFTMGVAGI